MEYYKNEEQLDFSDILLVPKLNDFTSRKEVKLESKYVNRNKVYQGIPIIAANMDGVGTFEMAETLSKYKISTCLIKHYSYKDHIEQIDFIKANSDYLIYSIGLNEEDYKQWMKFKKFYGLYKYLCIDVANGYSTKFYEFLKRVRKENQDIVLIAGNVVTKEGIRELHDCGIDIAKIGIGSGAVCTTRIQTGVGYPQFSAVNNCREYIDKNLWNMKIISDGGCTNSGDIAKAFVGGAHYVMLGSMLAGFNESGIADENGNMTFYGMSSYTAQNKHNGGVSEYRSSEGRTISIKHKLCSVEEQIKEILGGLRSTGTYIGCDNLSHFYNNTKIIKVKNQYNRWMENETISK